MTKLDSQDRETILIIDTNCDLMDNRNSNTKKLKQVYSEFQLEQLIKTYTRVAIKTSDNGTKRISKSLIDHFSTSKARYILKTDVLETGMVDHYLIYGIRKINAWRIKKPTIPPKIVEFRNMRKYDKSLFQEDLKQIDWKTILNTYTNDPSGMANTFQEIFSSVLNAHAPIKKQRVKTEFAPWLTPNIRKAMETRDSLKRIDTRIPEMWSSNAKQRNRVTKLIRNAIQDQYEEIVENSKGDPKKMWRTIDKVLNKDMQSTVLSNINEDGKVLIKDSDMLEALNHFVSVGTNLAKKIISKPDDDCLKYVVSVNNKRTLNTINTKYVLDAIGRLKNGKASGPDKVAIKLAKDAAKFIAYPIMCIFNSSIKNGIFPDVWKTASVTPIHKPGSKSDLNNYRPISVISVFARMLERLVHDQLSEFRTVNNILMSSQAAFCKLNSTTTSLISSTDHWHENKDNNKMKLARSLDLRKAFDTVDHNILIKKLNSNVSVDRTGGWFECYLSNRTQFYTLNENKSKQKKFTCGIPQGSCLGPLQFILYFNDFENSLQYSRASIYADNRNAKIASDGIQRMIDNANQEMLNLSDWMRINKLSSNPQKIEFMINCTL